MADIDFYQDDSEDAQDDGGEDGLGLDDYDGTNPDDNLTPIQRLEKYMDSENIFNRQMVARSLLDTLRLVDGSQEDSDTVLRAMARLSEDPEPTVRAELMEQVPHLAVYCHENKELFDNPISCYVLPTVVKYLTDSNNQVRKTSQAALLVLLEQELVDKSDVEKQVCPVILDLSGPDSIDDFRTEAVALMSKMAPLVGKDISERLFLPRFAELCTDALFHVRKVCAANFGDLCSVVGQEKTEEHLLPKFYYLCEDGVWGVRKACAECFMAVSCSCSLDVRRNELASLFISLICDQSRWVRMAAFQALGGFISTFADPAVTGLYFNEDGTLVVGNPEEIRMKLGLPKEMEQCLDMAAKGDGALIEKPKEASTASQGQEKSSPSAESVTSNSEDNTEIFEMELDEELTNGNNSSSEGIELGPSQDEVSPPHSEEKSREELRAEELTKENSDQKEENTSVKQEQETSSALSNTEESIATKELCPDSSAGEPSADVISEENACDICNNVNKESSQSSPAGQDVNVDICSPVVENASNENNDPSQTGQSEQLIENNENNNKLIAEDSSGSPVHIHLDNVDEFNSFQFWRSPLPAVNVDLDLVKGKPTNIHITMKTKKDGEQEEVVTTEIDLNLEAGTSESRDSVPTVVKQMKELSVTEAGSSQEGKEDATVQIFTANVSTVSDVETPTEETVANIGSTHVLGQQLNESTMAIVNGVVKGGGGADVSGSTSSLSYSPEDTPSSSQEHLHLSDLTQDVIPQPLLDHYLSMTDPSRAQTVDMEIAKHCAYSLPAVAYTLGRKHWPCIKELYETLAGDMQWKVRRTLAFSLHELAVIVGEDITNKDLVPVFNGFLKDLDEVRIGVLKHLSDFLRLLKPDIRRDYLTKLQDFLNTDNNRNWRFREELAEQLTLLIELYSAEDISKHLVPVALALAEDKVAEVRLTTFRVLAGMLRRLSEAEDKTLMKTFLEDLLERFIQSKKWNKRQIYAQLCQHILEEVAVPSEQFAEDLMPGLLGLSSDPIPNVRIVLAKTLAQYILTSEYFTSALNPHHESLLSTVQGLQADSDRDVRYFISRPPVSEMETPDMIPV